MNSTSRGSWAHKIIDEIALEGLEGVTLPTLWVLLGDRLELKSELSSTFKKQIWSFILRQEGKLQFFELPEERETRKLYNRFDDLDEVLGVPVAQEKNPYQRYKFDPLHESDIYGSCEHFKTRKEIKLDELRDKSLEAALECWGSKFVIVASQEVRFYALTPTNVPRPKEITPVQYAIWELIGRSRYNGEATSGNWSLQSIIKDSSIVFYIKTKLLRFNIVAQQNYNEKRGDRFMESTLLTLPRYYRKLKNNLETTIENLFVALKNTTDNRISTDDVREKYPAVSKLNALKRFMSTPTFRQIFETFSVPYAEINKRSKAKERQITYICLRHPDKNLDEVLGTNENRKEENPIEFVSQKHAFVDMPIEDEVYRAVVRHGSRGISLPELIQYMGVHNLTGRTLIKYMQREKLIKSYSFSRGRQRIIRYVATCSSEEEKKDDDNNMFSLENLKCDDEPKFPKISDVIQADIPSISAHFYPMKFGYKPIRADKYTKRIIDRQAVIVNQINEKCVMQMFDIRNAIQNKERAEGFPDELCRKSLFRLLITLSNSNIINCYELTLKYKDSIRLNRFVTHPKIAIDHPILKSEMLRLKNHFFIMMQEQKPSAKRLMPKVPSKLGKATQSSTTESQKYKTKPPKLFLARELHQFLYYILKEMKEDQAPLEMNAELLQQWRRSEPDLKTEEFLEEWKNEQPSAAMPYSNEMSWRTFIPPLPHYKDKPNGWLQLKDAVERVPLSLFNKLFRIERCTDDLIQSHLKHPIRQHYLLSQLPTESQCIISRLKLKAMYMSTLRLLSQMGLIQVSDWTEIRDSFLIWVYINQHSSLLDTTTSEPGYSQVNPKRQYISMKFEFTTREDVIQYWVQLQRVCIYSKLGFRCKRGNIPVARSKSLEFFRCVKFDEAEQYDTGEVPGDRLGAAGLSSNLFAYQFRHWSWALQTKKRPGILTAKTRMTGLSEAIRLKHKKVRLHVPPLRRRRLDRASTDEFGKEIKKSGPRDDIDRDALKNMRTLRTSWSKEEDKILKMARSVFLYISLPLSVLTLLHVAQIARDIIRSYLGICNKTIQACVRRMQFMIRVKRDVHEVPNWLFLLQTNEELSRTYDVNFLSNLKKEYPEKAQYTDAALVHFILILNTLNKIINDMNNLSLEQRNNFILPDSLAEFEKTWREYVPQDEDETIHHVNPKTERELKITIAQCVLHSTLCSARDKTLYNLQAFEIYKYFSEDILNSTFSKSRSETLVVSVKRRYIQVGNRQISGPSFFLSARYKHRLIYMKISYTTYDSYLQYFRDSLHIFFGNSKSTYDSDRPGLQLKSPHFAQLLYIGECVANNYLDINIKLPTNILTVDTSERPHVTASDRILDHFSNIFENAPHTEYVKQMEHEIGERKARVKFQPANLSYKVTYGPYDYISKLQNRSLHFFCALDHMQQPVDINFGKLQHKDDDANDGDGGGLMVLKCPFNCILKCGNYINAIERVVHENKAVLKDLSDEMTPQKLLNEATGDNAIIVQPSNVLTLVRMLETFWQEKEEIFDRKDFGRLPANFKSNRVIDWQSICSDIIGYNPDDYDNEQTKEFEPTLNKEERARAQDVFVINLPTINLILKEKLLEPGQETVKLHNMLIPKVLVETELQEKYILEKVKKEAYWTYTDNTFETLRPRLIELNYNDNEQQHIMDILNFIESYNFLGVGIQELKEKFPMGKCLLNALHLLADHFLIKRVGVSSYLYVHMKHIRDWIVHTFHIKRLERERLTNTMAPAIIEKRKKSIDFSERTTTTDDTEITPSCSKKFKLNDGIEQSMTNKNDSNDIEYIDIGGSSSNKKMKLDDGSSSAVPASSTDDDQPTTSKALSSKRKSKAVQRYESEQFAASKDSGQNSSVHLDVERNVIVMRPQPWMRVNGSLNRRVLDRWLSSIVTECITRTGCTVHSLFFRFPHMLPVDLMFLLELLCDLKCIHLVESQMPDITLESAYDDAEISEEEVTEFYEPTVTYIKAHSDAAGRIANFIGVKKYNLEFI